MSDDLTNATTAMTIRKPRRKRNKNKAKNENTIEQPSNENQSVPLGTGNGQLNNDLALTTYQPLTADNSALFPRAEYNVLLLGQTGVGKSTFINALANYIKFENFNTAKDSNLDVLIPCKFSVWNEKYEREEIRFGSDLNENLDQAGHSSTQRCKEYVFPFENSLIHIFDTPGVGDTRGVDQDKLNLEEILGSLSEIEDLHCICILMKPNESRLTATFEFCIKQLLCHLQKNAANNIVFVFTNSRGTFYRPGDTTVPLTSILDKIRTTPPRVDIPFGENNVFCLDNEAFRFLLALKQGIHFDSKQQEEFGQSWETSVEGCKRLLQFVINGESERGMLPHKIKETLSVNQARRLIVDLSRPLAQIAQNIQDNLVVLNEHEKVILDCSHNVNELKKNLYMPTIELQVNEVLQPKTVCHGKGCAVPYKIGTLTKYHYPQKCHDPCYLEEVPREVVGEEKLRHCRAIDPENAFCMVCRCHYSQHLHIYYESSVVETKVEDEDVKKRIKNKTSALEAAKQQVNRLQWQASMFRKEEKKLTKLTAKLAVFLKQNAIVAYNDAFQDYLNQLIDNEKSLRKHGSNNQQVIEGLQRMVKEYLQEQDVLEKTLNRHSHTEHIEPEVVFDIVAELQQMTLMGGTLQLTMKASSNASRRPRVGTANSSNILMKAINWGIDKFARQQ